MGFGSGVRACFDCSFRIVARRQTGSTAGQETPGAIRALTMEVEALPLMFTPRPIGFVHSPYQETSAIPRGLGAKHDAEGTIEMLPEFAAGLTDIEGFSHLFILWVFDRQEGFDLIAHPPSDEKRPHGVFSTRSPRRPNPIGLTVVELLGYEGAVVRVRGVDMLDQTPVLDIKPYLSSIPMEKLRRGWLTEAEQRKG